ncbi:hypothetical protein Tco_1283905 [Tanacetum coccineum]
MPTNLRIYDGSIDTDDHISRFVGAANQGEWEMSVWCRMFQQTLDERFALRRRCSKEPTEISKIVRRASETLPNFKERWTEEMGYIQGVPEVMQISAFLSNSKFPELARRFTDQVPQTATEMMKRVNDFVKFEEAFRSTELPGGSKRKGDMRRHIGDCPTSYHDSPLEIVLESGKLNHLIKDVRQRAGNRGRQVGNNSSNEVKGYLVRRVFVYQGAAEQVMFEHCFSNLSPTIQARLAWTHTELVGFLGEQLLPMGKINLEVLFGSEGLSRRTMMNFTVVEASSPYNIILGRTRMRELCAISSTTHAMMKFPTLGGIATLVPRRDAIFECRQLEDRQIPPGKHSGRKRWKKKKA